MNNYGLLHEEFNLKNYNSYKLDVKCRYFIEVLETENLKKLLQEIKQQNLKYFIIGSGTNLILPAYYDGVIIKLRFNDFKIEDNVIRAGSSSLLTPLAIESVKHNLEGLDWATGIPGTVGGAIVNNAGAYKSSIMEYVREIKVLINEEEKILKKEQIDYGYRFTSLKNTNVIILEATFDLSYGNKDDLMNTIELRKAKRIETQPFDYPSAGSVFRNPINDYAGRLIEECNLKGYAIGGAKVSEKHANFIINYDNATSEDIVSLINYIKKTVYEKYNIELILEQQIIS